MLRAPVRVVIAVLAAALLLALPATPATAASKRKSAAPVTPVITSINPLTPSIGEVVTIRGKHFLKGKGKNTVVFLSSVGRAVFVKDQGATTTRIKLRLPDKLSSFLKNKGGKPVRTRFRVRILAKRFGRTFTATGKSPRIGPRKPDSLPPVDAAGPDGDCDNDGVKNKAESDDDGDGLVDTLETQIKTTACLRDTDGDGIEDGYEYRSALDLNSIALPYPGKRPYPNPLDPSDVNLDHDGDSLTLGEEYAAWVKYGQKKFPMNYSAGQKSTGGHVDPPTGALAYLNMMDDGEFTDDERDIDGDGLNNYMETHGPLGGPGWWTAVYKDEKPYELPFKGTDWLDPDTDGDGRLDGADDVDHDGWTNREEWTRDDSIPGRGTPATLYWVQPFNPCLPDFRSPTCTLHPPIVDPYPPFVGGWGPLLAFETANGSSWLTLTPAP